MKELSNKYCVYPAEFCRLVPKLSNREHAKSDHALDEIYKDEKFDNRLKTELTDDQYKYVRELIDMASTKFPTAGDLRNAFSKKIEIFDSSEPDAKYDTSILGRIFM